MSRLPTLFLSHGSPMNAVGRTASSDAWARLARALPQPRAVLVASAHWETRCRCSPATRSRKRSTISAASPKSSIGSATRPPAPRNSAAEAVALLKEAGITAGVNGCRGLDHGAWVPLSLDVPGRRRAGGQISLQPGLGAARHVELGRALAPLAGDGVLIVGSGHATHNLRDWMANPRRQEPLALRAGVRRLAARPARRARHRGARRATAS